MDPLAKKCLEERVFEAVQRLLTVGDHAYLQGLSRTSFLEALENELRFLGFYAHGDRETPEAIHIILEQHLDQWRKRYLEERERMLCQAHSSQLLQCTFK